MAPLAVCDILKRLSIKMKKYLAIPMNIQVDLHEMFLHCKGPLGTIKLEIPSSLRVELDEKSGWIKAKSTIKLK